MWLQQQARQPGCAAATAATAMACALPLRCMRSLAHRQCSCLGWTGLTLMRKHPGPMSRCPAVTGQACSVVRGGSTWPSQGAQQRHNQPAVLWRCVCAVALQTCALACCCAHKHVTAPRTCCCAPTGSPEALRHEMARLAALADALAATDAATASLQPDAEADPGGSLLVLLRAWRLQRRQAVAAELTRLARQLARQKWMLRWQAPADVAAGDAGGAAGPGVLAAAYQQLVDWLQQQGAEVRGLVRDGISLQQQLHAVSAMHSRRTCASPAAGRRLPMCGGAVRVPQVNVAVTPADTTASLPPAAAAGAGPQTCGATAAGAAGSCDAGGAHNGSGASHAGGATAASASRVYAARSVAEGQPLAVLPLRLAYPVQGGMGRLVRTAMVTAQWQLRQAACAGMRCCVALMGQVPSSALFSCAPLCMPRVHAQASAVELMLQLRQLTEDDMAAVSSSSAGAVQAAAAAGAGAAASDGGNASVTWAPLLRSLQPFGGPGGLYTFPYASLLAAPALVGGRQRGSISCMCLQVTPCLCACWWQLSSAAAASAASSGVALIRTAAVRQQEGHVVQVQAALSTTWERHRARIEAADDSLSPAELAHALDLVRCCHWLGVVHASSTACSMMRMRSACSRGLCVRRQPILLSLLRLLPHSAPRCRCT